MQMPNNCARGNDGFYISCNIQRKCKSPIYYEDVVKEYASKNVFEIVSKNKIKRYDAIFY